MNIAQIGGKKITQKTQKVWGGTAELCEKSWQRNDCKILLV